ncbi:MAG: hypothetical protein WCJ58_06955 [bacterium]
MYYFFNIFIHKFLTVIFNNFLVPVSIFVLASPLIIVIIYSFENKINITVQKFSHNEFIVNNFKNPSTAENNSLNQLNLSLTVNNKDYRAVVLDAYFEKYNSPLSGYGQVFVDACDKYQAPHDCTTIPAIGFVETRLCTLAASLKEKNCWGYGGSPPNRILFDKFEDAIDLITKRLVSGYGPSYMTDPVSMQHIYCGPNCNSWGSGVQQQRDAINKLSQDLGYPKLF